MIKLWWTGTDRDSHPWFLRIYSELILSPLTFALDRDLCVDLIWRFNNSPAFPGTSEPCARKNELFAFKHLHVLSSKRVFRWKRLDTFGSNFLTRPGEVQIPPPPLPPGRGVKCPWVAQWVMLKIPLYDYDYVRSFILPLHFIPWSPDGQMQRKPLFVNPAWQVPPL